MDLIGWIFFGPAKLISHAPYAGLLISAALISVEVIRTLASGTGFSRAWFRRASVFTGLLWAIFNLYELQLAAVLGSALANAGVLLRLDLIVLTPILYVMTGVAVYGLLQKSR